MRAHDGPGRSPQVRPRRPSRRCAARWTPCRSTARSSSAKASATRRRCSTSARRSAWRTKAQVGRTLSAGRHRRRSARGHEPLRDRRAERDRRARRVGEGRAAARARPLHGEARRRPELAATSSISTRRCATTCARSRSRSAASVEDLVVIVLDRPRHEKLIAEIRATGARIRLIGDGDLSAGIAAAVVGTGVHAVMGTGGAPEGVLTAAAMRCLERRDLRAPRDQQARGRRALPRDGHHGLQARSIDRRISRPGKSIIFAATGVTDGSLMKGVRFFGDGIAHQLAGDADQSAPDSLHRQHSRRGFDARSGQRFGFRYEAQRLPRAPLPRQTGGAHEATPDT